jgi:hypothetical protein
MLMHGTATLVILLPSGLTLLTGVEHGGSGLGADGGGGTHLNGLLKYCCPPFTPTPWIVLIAGCTGHGGVGFGVAGSVGGSVSL